jgi:alkylated DNA repair dioxygenase AlkB
MSLVLTLFDQPPVAPEGFHYYADFIDTAEEQLLIANIREFALHPMVFQGYTAKRKVASFGYDFNFNTRKLNKGRNIPESFAWLISKVAAQLMIPVDEIAELLLTEYPPGSVINWHRDAPPFETIAGVSLGTDCIFKLRPYERSQRSRKSVISLPVAPRSLYIIKGPARSDWEHSTAPVAATRYSITLRTLAQGEK